MPMKYISNAFSLNMLSQKNATIKTREVTLEEAKELAPKSYSVVGHSDVAAVMSANLGQPVACNRASVLLQPGDDLLVGQYVGPRLPEGCTELPEGATLTWIHVQVF